MIRFFVGSEADVAAVLAGFRSVSTKNYLIISYLFSSILSGTSQYRIQEFPPVMQFYMSGRKPTLQPSGR